MVTLLEWKPSVTMPLIMVVGIAGFGQASCDRGRHPSGVEQGALIDLERVGGDLQA
jgi:hypothetical protein